MVIGMLYLKHGSWCADSWWILRSGKKAVYETIHHPHALDSDEDGLKRLWPQTISFGGTSEAVWLPEWERDSRPKVWGESVSLMPLGEEVEDRKIQSRKPGSFSESLGILPFPARDLWTRFHQLPSENKPGTVQSARLSARRWNMAALLQQVAYSPTVQDSACVEVLQAHSKSRVQCLTTSYCITWLNNNTVDWEIRDKYEK